MRAEGSRPSFLMKLTLAPARAAATALGLEPLPSRGRAGKDGPRRARPGGDDGRCEGDVGDIAAMMVDTVVAIQWIFLWVYCHRSRGDSIGVCR